MTPYLKRRLAYLDPGLPAEVLPPRWQGDQAAEVFFRLRERLQDAAHAHVLDACRASAVGDDARQPASAGTRVAPFVT